MKAADVENIVIRLGIHILRDCLTTLRRNQPVDAVLEDVLRGLFALFCIVPEAPDGTALPDPFHLFERSLDMLDGMTSCGNTVSVSVS